MSQESTPDLHPHADNEQPASPPDETHSSMESTESRQETNSQTDLQAQLAELQAKNAELTEQYLRAQAEVQNMRRRTDEDMSKARKFAIEGFAESLLPVLDSFEAALAIQNVTLEQVREGNEATLKQLKSALERNKVIEINPAPKDRFDPHLHQAISTVAQEGFEANTVVAVLQKGYQIAERVLRPALVTVAQSA